MFYSWHIAKIFFTLSVPVKMNEVAEIIATTGTNKNKYDTELLSRSIKMVAKTIKDKKAATPHNTIEILAKYFFIISTQCLAFYQPNNPWQK